MKELTCNILRDKEIGPIETKCTLLNILDNKYKKGHKIAIVKEESEQFGITYTIWDLEDWKKLEKNF